MDVTVFLLISSADICRQCAGGNVMDHACYGGYVCIWRPQCSHHDFFQVINWILDLTSLTLPVC
jgi:hypothetical protein